MWVSLRLGVLLALRLFVLSAAPPPFVLPDNQNVPLESRGVLESRKSTVAEACIHAPGFSTFGPTAPTSSLALRALTAPSLKNLLEWKSGNRLADERNVPTSAISHDKVRKKSDQESSRERRKTATVFQRKKPPDRPKLLRNNPNSKSDYLRCLAMSKYCSLKPKSPEVKSKTPDISEQIVKSPNVNDIIHDKMNQFVTIIKKAELATIFSLMNSKNLRKSLIERMEKTKEENPINEVNKNLQILFGSTLGSFEIENKDVQDVGSLTKYNMIEALQNIDKLFRVDNHFRRDTLEKRDQLESENCFKYFQKRELNKVKCHSTKFDYNFLNDLEAFAECIKKTYSRRKTKHENQNQAKNFLRNLSDIKKIGKFLVPFLQANLKNHVKNRLPSTNNHLQTSTVASTTTSFLLEIIKLGKNQETYSLKNDGKFSRQNFSIYPIATKDVLQNSKAGDENGLLIYAYFPQAKNALDMILLSYTTPGPMVHGPLEEQYHWSKPPLTMQYKIPVDPHTAMVDSQNLETTTLKNHLMNSNLFFSDLISLFKVLEDVASAPATSSFKLDMESMKESVTQTSAYDAITQKFAFQGQQATTAEGDASINQVLSNIQHLLTAYFNLSDDHNSIPLILLNDSNPSTNLKTMMTPEKHFSQALTFSAKKPKPPYELEDDDDDDDDEMPRTTLAYVDSTYKKIMFTTKGDVEYEKTSGLTAFGKLKFQNI